MEIKVRCHKEGEDWNIEDPGPIRVTEREVVWTFEGLKASIVPLLVFDTEDPEQRPFGPFHEARFTAASIRAELRELPEAREWHHCTILLVQWKPEGSEIIASLGHELIIEAPKKAVIHVYWNGGAPYVEPNSFKVFGGWQVEWQFEDLPEAFFTTLDFQERTSSGLTVPRPLGPFRELYGRREDGEYRLTGWTDSHKASYQYTVSFYDRRSQTLVAHPDPQLDNNGTPPHEDEEA